MSPEAGAVTNLLAAFRNGQLHVLSELLEIVCPELRRIAGLLMRRERRGHLLRPTALFNQAFLREFAGNGWLESYRQAQTAEQACGNQLSAMSEKQVKHLDGTASNREPDSDLSMLLGYKERKQAVDSKCGE